MEERVKDMLKQHYGAHLNLDKFFDAKEIYICHVQTPELHGLFFNLPAMTKLKRSFHHLLQIGEQYIRFFQDQDGPFSLKVHCAVLRKWYEKGYLPGSGVRHDTTTREELNAVQHVLVMGGGFLPAIHSYALGSAILEILNGVSQTFELFSRITKLAPEKWETTTQKCGEDSKIMKNALDDLVTLIVGYDGFIRQVYPILSGLLPKIPDDLHTYVAILGDCNPEFWCKMPEKGKRNCCFVSSAPLPEEKKQQTTSRE